MRSADHLVSVIVPVRNGARYLAEALGSVRAQTFHPVELIVVDGGSTDDSLAIAQSFQPNCVIHQQQPGLWPAFNLGLQAAQGAYITFLGSDDRWTPDKLSRQVDYLDQQAGVQAVIGQVVFFVADGQPAPQGFRQRLIGQPLAFRVLEALMVRRSLFQALDPFNESLAFGADTDWFARLQDAGVPIATLPHVLLYKRLHDANNSLSAPQTQQDILLRITRQSLVRKRARASERERREHN